MGATKVAESDYLDAVDNYTGWCTKCKDFTRDSTEPDAEGYDCPECEQDTVIGAENALIQGLIEFSGEEEED
jgi:Zn finger protein HypA/HybF involved in hydrogenase expression